MTARGAGLALALVAGAAGAQQKALVISAPPNMVLGEQDKVQVELKLGGVLAYGTQVRTHASVGQLTDLAAGGRSMVGVYLPPSQLFPQVAILGAVAKVDGKTVVAFQPLPLFGVGDMPVQGKKGQMLTIKVGPLTFGPVKADRAGHATVRIRVPPGYDAAIANGKRIELGEAPFKRILAVALDDQVAADGASTTGIQAMVVDKYGKPDPLARVFARVDRGKVTPVNPIGPGLYAATYTAPSEVGNGADKVMIGVVGEELSRDTVALKLVRGAARKVNAWVEPAAYEVGSPPPMVWVSVADAAGAPLDANVELSADIGRFGPTRKTGPGKYVANFTPPDQFGGRKEIAITATAVTPGAGPVKREVALGLRPGKPNQVVVVNGKYEGVADGHSPVSFTFHVLDRQGNPVPNAPVTVKADTGATEPPQPTSDGYTVRYVPPVSFEPMGANVTIQAEGNAHAVLPIHLAASENLVMLGARAGYETNLGSLQTPTLGVDIGARMMFLDPHVFATLEVSATSTLPGQTFPSDPTISSSVLIPSGSLQAQYRIPVGDFIMWGGAGPVLGVVFGRIQQEGFPERSERLLALGAEAAAGFGYRFGRSTVGIDGRYRYMPVNGLVVQGAAGGVLASLRFDIEL
ncbi:MAG TPA: Ig-like domain-containing protein [Myxococcaceae bacterium]|nr:Ig-like domain-containing protein [Myxococcaceae bacterium]